MGVRHCSFPRAIERAIARGDTPSVAALLESGNDASGLLHEAVRGGVDDIVALVLAHGADPDERNRIGETPLFTAARYGRADLAELLLQRGADPNARCKAGGSVLEAAEPWPHVGDLLERAGARTRPRQGLRIRISRHVRLRSSRRLAN
jgi:ankyrin repeat protein